METIYIDTTLHGFEVDIFKHDTDNIQKLIAEYFGCEYGDDLTEAIIDYIFKECRHLKANNEKGSQSSLKMGNVNIQITYEV